MFAKYYLILGSLNAILAVITAAFAAHALKHRLSAQNLEVCKTSVDYHFYHTLGIPHIRWLGEITAVGGTTFILAWLSLLYGLIQL